MGYLLGCRLLQMCVLVRNFFLVLDLQNVFSNDRARNRIFRRLLCIEGRIKYQSPLRENSLHEFKLVDFNDRHNVLFAKENNLSGRLGISDAGEVSMQVQICILDGVVVITFHP